MNSSDDESDNDLQGEDLQDIREGFQAELDRERPFRRLLNSHRVPLVNFMNWEPVLDYLLTDPVKGLPRSDQTDRMQQCRNNRESRRVLIDAIHNKDRAAFLMFVRGLAQPDANPDIAKKMARDADEKRMFNPPLLPQVEAMSEVRDYGGLRGEDEGVFSNPVQATPSLSESGITLVPTSSTPQAVSLVDSAGGFPFLSGAGGLARSSSISSSSTAALSTEESQEAVRQRSYGSDCTTPLYATGGPSTSYQQTESVQSETTAEPIDETVPPMMDTDIKLSGEDGPPVEVCEGAGDGGEHHHSHEEYSGTAVHPLMSSEPLYMPEDGVGGGSQRDPFRVASGDGDGGGGNGGDPGGDGPSSVEVSPANSSVSNVQRRQAAGLDAPWYESRGFPAAAICALGLVCILLVPPDRAQHVVVLTALGMGVAYML